MNATNSWCLDHLKRENYETSLISIHDIREQIRMKKEKPLVHAAKSSYKSIHLEIINKPKRNIQVTRWIIEK